MASKRAEVEELNKILSEYLKRVGMREEAKLEFISKASSMADLDSYRSVWFHSFTSQLSHILNQIQLPPPPPIDLNEPPPPQHHNTDEDEASSNGHGKRQRIASAALRIRESNIPQIDLVSASDSE